MRLRIMRFATCAVVLVVLATSCRRNAAWEIRDCDFYGDPEALTSVLPLVSETFRLALVGDSVALRRRVTDDVPLRSLLYQQRTEPGLFRTAAGPPLKVCMAGSEDTMNVELFVAYPEGRRRRLPEYRTHEHIVMTFVPDSAGNWLLHRWGTLSRF